ncbi:DUF421 domain-containing protein [Bacillus nitroreducens]
MNFIKEILLVYGRIITILPLLLVMTLYMGKRSIGQLPVFDLLIIITLGSVVGADIADPHVEHIHTAFAIVGIAILQRVITYLILRHRKIGRALTFEPTIVIMNGVFIVENIREIRYSLDNILQMLREKEVFDVSTVEVGIVEANGMLSVYKKANKSPVLREDLGVENNHEKLTYPVIIEGKVDHSILTQFGTNESWLLEKLEEKGIKKMEDVFFASISSDLNLHLSPVNSDKPNYIRH